ncbi:hypothetical protein MMC34_008348 [Xylographa carneopallida]|nr:hypothetical protein [Xylographa carneopallida]
MSLRASSILALLLLLGCCWSGAVQAQPAQPPSSQGVYPPVPYRQLAAYTDVFPGKPQIDVSAGVAVDDSGDIYIVRQTHTHPHPEPTASRCSVTHCCVSSSALLCLTAQVEIFDSQVLVLYPNHTEKASFPVQLYSVSITIDAAGSLYTSSLIFPEVVKYNQTGGVEFTYDVPSAYASGLVVDKAGNLWAGFDEASAPAPSVAVYNTSGGLVASFLNYTSGYVAINPARDTVYVVGGTNASIDVYDTATLSLIRQISTGANIVSYLTVTPSGTLYVSTTDAAVYELSADGAVLADLSGDFAYVIGLTYSAVTGLVYINDEERSQVVAVDPTTNSVTTIYRGGLQFAENAALDSQGNIYITSTSGVLALYPNGTEKAVLEQDVGIATQVVVTADDVVYVSSYAATSTAPVQGFVTVFKPDGTLSARYNYSGAATNTQALGLAVDTAAGVLYVLNGAGQIVVMRTADGVVTAVYNTTYNQTYGGVALSSSGLLYIGTGPQQGVAVFSTAGVQQAEYSLAAYGVQPYSLTLDNTGTLYVCDTVPYAGRVLLMDASTGVVRGQYQPPLYQPTVYFENYGQLGVAVDAQGDLYVAHLNQLIKVQPATGPSVTVNIATGFTTADYSQPLSTSDGALDGSWRVDGEAAVVLTDNGIDFNPAWEPNGPTSDWVGLPASAAGGTTADSYNFTRTFSLPASVDTSTLTFAGRIICDKRCTLYLNGVELIHVYESAGPYGSYSLSGYSFQANQSQLLLGGVNTLLVVLSTVNQTADYALQYNGVRVEGYFNAISTGGSSSVLGDPQFVGLRGQSYQVHGIDGAVYNLISDAAVQLNARFTYLSGGHCPRDVTTNTPLFTCWTHPGSYLSELALRTSGGDYVRLVAGKAQQGFAVVELGSTNSSSSRRVLSVGDTATLSVLDEAGAATTATVSYDGLRSVRISHAGLYTLVVENSDGFLNILSLAVSSMHALATRVHSHGLIGQTWRAAAEVKGSEVREVEGYVDDYTEAGGDMLGCDFVYNKHAC